MKYIDTLTKWVGHSTIWLWLGLIGLVVMEVTLRKGFNTGTFWSFEVSKFIYAALFLLPVGYVLAQKEHIAVDVLSKRFSQRTQTWLIIICYIVFFFPMCCILFKESIDYTYISWVQKERSWSTFAPPIYPIKTVIPIAFFLLGIQGIAEFGRTVISLKRCSKS